MLYIYVSGKCEVELMGLQGAFNMADGQSQTLLL